MMLTKEKNILMCIIVECVSFDQEVFWQKETELYGSIVITNNLLINIYPSLAALRLYAEDSHIYELFMMYGRH